MRELILMAHVVFGVGCLLASVWLFVDVLNAREENQVRIRWVSRAAAIFMWLAFVVGGYWYVVDYKTDKAVILKGPWPFAHNYFMETKEHFGFLAWCFNKMNAGEGPTIPVSRLTNLILAGVVTSVVIVLGFYLIAD